MNEDTTSQPQVGPDQMLGFAIPHRDCRGRVVRLGPVLDEILDAHEYPSPIRLLLAEALVVTTLMGGLLKGEQDQLTLQVQTGEGVVTLLVCDFQAGELRGYAQFDEERARSIGANPTLATFFGAGHLAITFDVASSGQRYQGIVPLDGATLSEAIEGYFAQSEQIPTLIRSGVRATKVGCVAAGLLVQHLPDGEIGRDHPRSGIDHPHWEHVATLGSSVRCDELVDTEIGLEDLIWRLYHEEDQVLVSQGLGVQRGCRCSEAHFKDVLSRFPAKDRREMREEDGAIHVDCAFCSREFRVRD